MNRLIRFYTVEDPDHRGRFIHDIWALDEFWLEHTHDYIQWLFPIPEQGRFNGFAPVLQERDQQIFRGSDELQRRQRTSLDLLLNFLGLSRETEDITPQPQLSIQRHIWLKPGGHNHLRITRMIRSLHLCGQEELAKAVQGAVITIGSREGLVSERSIKFWRSATD